MAERATKPRWEWASYPIVQQILGVFIFLLACAIALPILGFNVPHAASIFIIALGLVEQDGLAILIGVLAGLASLILITGANLSSKALQSGAVGWVKKMVKKVGLKWAADLGLKWATSFLKKRGRQWTTLLLLEWAEKLLEPEATKPVKAKRSRKKVAGKQPKRSATRGSQVRARPLVGRARTRGSERSVGTERQAISV
jgi:hypothetical protein